MCMGHHTLLWRSHLYWAAVLRVRMLAGDGLALRGKLTFQCLPARTPCAHPEGEHR
jgi:hypothetical protein